MRTSPRPAPALAATAAALALLAPLLGLAAPAHAATAEVVTEADVVRQAENTAPTDAWVLYTRTGTPATAGSFVDGPSTPPSGTGSLRLSTTTSSEKVFLLNYDHVGTALGAVDHLSYSTFRSAGTGNQLAALNVQVDPNGPDVPGGFTTLVFEPVYNLGQQPITTDTWQSWTANGAGVWWSTQPIAGQCAGATSSCDKTWDEIVANNPAATVLAVGVNQGSGNGGLVTNVDAFAFDETVYDFERVGNTKDACKDGGWATFTNPTFQNQGQCVSYFANP